MISKVEQVKSPIVQSQDYYLFGLTYDSYTKEDPVTIIINTMEKSSGYEFTSSAKAARYFMN